MCTESNVALSFSNNVLAYTALTSNIAPVFQEKLQDQVLEIS